MSRGGRRMKARENDVVRLLNPPPIYGVVARTRPGIRRAYGVVMSRHSQGRRAYGPLLWLAASDFEATGKRNVVPARDLRTIYREVGVFDAMERRGCDCVCCPHSRGWEPDERESK